MTKAEVKVLLNNNEPLVNVVVTVGSQTLDLCLELLDLRDLHHRLGRAIQELESRETRLRS